jgi:hypothetical protein
VEEPVENTVEIHWVFINDKFCIELRLLKFTGVFPELHQNWALTITFAVIPLLASTVERVGKNKSLSVRSRLSDLQAGVTRKAIGPEKTGRLCEEPLGFGTAKAVIASRVVTVHASTLLAPSQELMTRA